MTWSRQLSKGRPSQLAATAPSLMVRATPLRLSGQSSPSGWRPLTGTGQVAVQHPRSGALTPSRASRPVSVPADLAGVPILARSCPAFPTLRQSTPDGGSTPEHKDTSEFQRLVNISQYCGNCEPRHVRHAERLLCKEQEASRLKEASDTGNPQLIRSAVVRAEKAGVSRDVIDAARHSALELEALTMMENAVMDGDADALHTAMQRARGAKVAKQEILAAQALLIQFRARDRLSVALKGGNIEAVRYAVREAQAQEIRGPELQEAQHWLVQVEALRALESAMLKQDAEALRHCLSEASAAQLRRTPIVQRAEQFLEKMDASEALRSSLRGDPQELKAAIADAREAGVEARELDVAERFLRGPVLPAAAAEASLRVSPAGSKLPSPSGFRRPVSGGLSRQVQSNSLRSDA